MVILEINVLKNAMKHVPNVIMSMVCVSRDVFLAGEVISAMKVAFIISNFGVENFQAGYRYINFQNNFNIKKKNYATHKLNATTLLHGYSECGIFTSNSVYFI